MPDRSHSLPEGMGHPLGQLFFFSTLADKTWAAVGKSGDAARFFIATESQYLHLHSVRPPSDPSESAPLSLASACCGQRLRIVSLPKTGSECLRMRELGICEHSFISKLGDGPAILCAFSGGRMAVGRTLGAEVIVEAV